MHWGSVRDPCGIHGGSMWDQWDPIIAQFSAWVAQPSYGWCPRPAWKAYMRMAQYGSMAWDTNALHGVTKSPTLYYLHYQAIHFGSVIDCTGHSTQQPKYCAVPLKSNRTAVLSHCTPKVGIVLDSLTTAVDGSLRRSGFHPPTHSLPTFTQILQHPKDSETSNATVLLNSWRLSRSTGDCRDGIALRPSL